MGAESVAPRRPGPVRPTRVPILLYHSVSSTPSRYIAPFAVSPADFRRHLACIVEHGCTPLTVSDFVAAANDHAFDLPERPVIVTFDDGYVDFFDVALPMFLEYGIPSTIYITTGFVAGGSDRGRDAEAPGVMLSWSHLRELVGHGVEIGGHTHTHPQLDVVTARDAREEITRCKALLEDALDVEIRSFAYPHGYSSSTVRRFVREAGYESACSVKNALSSADDDRFSLARLMLRNTTSVDQVREWLLGRGAPDAPARERAQTRVWRLVRRIKHLASTGPRHRGTP
jgi:peptidoglycan/xylan/chitin deacetylase (PgdA/CDA1 family)